MRLINTTLLIIILLALSGCSLERNRESAPPSTTGTSTANTNTSTTTEQPAQRYTLDSKSAGTTAPSAQAVSNSPTYQKVSQQSNVSLAQADSARAAEVAVERKIIRNANLTLEVNTPADSQRKITSIAEGHGGFVVTSEARQSNSEGQAKPETTVTITVRVPATQFVQVLDEIRGVGSRVTEEKITGQDVTEEYFDLEARIKTKKALEAQFLEIMKQAHTVSDALEVQSQLAEVRTEIERLEGRRRYLENQSSLSTITVTLQTPAAIVNTSGFFYSLKRAFGNGVDIAESITLFLIQALLALIPVALLIFLPIGLLIRYLYRRSRRHRLAQKLAQDAT